MASTSNQPQNDKVKQMMKKMGYKEGKGIGKDEQGITEPVEARGKIGRRGLGADTKQQHEKMEAFFDSELEHKPVEENPDWLECSEQRRTFVADQLEDEWITLGTPITKDEEFKAQNRYCGADLISELLEAKNVFDTMDRKEVEAARTRANPYETIKAGFFQNRAAMKTANLDKIFGWLLSWEFDERKRLAKNPLTAEQEPSNVDRHSSLFYFADVCAGPGGFSEYMLWRKGYYNAKGFGFTLEGKDDFKLDRFKAAPAEYFETYYGVKGDGDVMAPENLLSLAKYVHDRTHSGVHLVMCDGGFSVEGQENLQEVLSKRLYLCQFIVGLSLCRAVPSIKIIKPENGEKAQPKGGNFLCKLFDVFTPFSMGLIYLMYISFERISIHKPITSRPANSERYIFCENLNTLGAGKVKQYLTEVNNRLDAMERKEEDIMELVPDEVISGDEQFMEYMSESIEKIARRQVFYLKKYKHFASDLGKYDEEQSKLRDQALNYWELPDHIERIREIPRNRKRNHHMAFEEQSHVQNREEPVVELFKRLSQRQICFPIKTRIAQFTDNVLRVCPDVAELRAMFLPEPDDGTVLLVSQGHKKLFMHRRTGSNFEFLDHLHTTIPPKTILLAQCTTLYELKQSGKIEPACKCLWVLDAAVLNGDDVSQMDLKARMAAVRKFATAMNQLQLREAKFERNSNEYRRHNRMQFAGHRINPFGELLVAEPKRLNALTEHKFETKQFKGSRMAFLPVWARNDSRNQPPQRHFVTCRGIRVQNVLNPNFMLTRNERLEEMVDVRPGAELDQKQCTSFYASLIGHLPTEQLIKSYPNGHPHGGAITFYWSWEPDYTMDFGIEQILGTAESSKGLTMRAVQRIIREREHPSEGPKRKLEGQTDNGGADEEGPPEKRRSGEEEERQFDGTKKEEEEQSGEDSDAFG